MRKLHLARKNQLEKVDLRFLINPEISAILSLKNGVPSIMACMGDNCQISLLHNYSEPHYILHYVIIFPRSLTWRRKVDSHNYWRQKPSSDYAVWNLVFVSRNNRFVVLSRVQLRIPQFPCLVAPHFHNQIRPHISWEGKYLPSWLVHPSRLQV